MRYVSKGNKPGVYTVVLSPPMLTAESFIMSELQCQECKCWPTDGRIKTRYAPYMPWKSTHHHLQTRNPDVVLTPG